jgi:hypothetical protein
MEQGYGQVLIVNAENGSLMNMPGHAAHHFNNQNSVIRNFIIRYVSCLLSY